MNPEITVVMPAHNTEKYIGAAIQSILNQTYPYFKLWVLENGSTDRTAQVAQQFNDERVKVLELGPVGFQGALKFALENAQTEWLARMDSDDLCFPNRLEKQIQSLQMHPEYALAGTSKAILTPFGTIIQHLPRYESKELTIAGMAIGKCSLAFPQGRFSPDASMLFRRSAALDVGGYDPEFKMGDVPLWLRMLEHYRGWEIAEDLYLYRLLPASFSSTHMEGIAARAKYSPEHLDDFLQSFGLQKDQKVPNRQRSQKCYWRHIALLELFAGNYHAACRAIAKMLNEPDWSRQDWIMVLRVTALWLGHYQTQNRYKAHYCHRPDWEQLFSEQNLDLNIEDYL